LLQTPKLPWSPVVACSSSLSLYRNKKELARRYMWRWSKYVVAVLQQQQSEAEVGSQRAFVNELA
jgi:hypothetical protein